MDYPSPFSTPELMDWYPRGQYFHMAPTIVMNCAGPVDLSIFMTVAPPELRPAPKSLGISN